MGGYVAEKIAYGETTTGTKNDIEQATMLARRMVTEFGMSEKASALFHTELRMSLFSSARK